MTTPTDAKAARATRRSHERKESAGGDADKDKTEISVAAAAAAETEEPEATPSPTSMPTSAGEMPTARRSTRRSTAATATAKSASGSSEESAVASSEQLAGKDVPATDTKPPARNATKAGKETTNSEKETPAPPAATTTEEVVTNAASAVATSKESDVSDASTVTETASDNDPVASKRGANKRTPREDESVESASARAAKVAKDAVATSVAQANPVQLAQDVAAAPAISQMPMPTATVPTSAAPSDLKRGADAMSDASSTATTPVAGSVAVAPKAKRVRKTREEKLAILAFVDDGGTHVAAAEKFGVSRTAVTKMVKERDIIMSGLSGKQHAAANGTPQVVAAALGAALPPPTAALGSAPVVGESAPTPPAARKSRASSSSSTASASATTRQQQTGDGTQHPKAKRVRKTNEEKLLILEFVENGGSQGAAAEKFGVSRTAVTKMVKEREAITAQVMSGKSNHRKVLQYQHKLSIIEDMLYKWQVQVENDAPNLKITGDLLQSKAVEFRDKILAEWKSSLEPDVVQSLSDFKASNGWLHRYLQRRNLRTASKREYHRRPNPNGGAVIPASPSDPFNVNMFASDITQRLRTVPVQCIWNMDEIALLPKICSIAPSRDLGAETAPSDRMTIVLMVNAAGEKFKLEILISDAYIEKLDALQKAYPNIMLTSQHNAWQDTTALALYLHQVSAQAKLRQETWYIVMDASPSHMEFAQLVDPGGSFEQGYRFESLVLMFLSPQATPDQHPLHQGVARVFKAAYRQSMLVSLAQKWNQGLKTEGPDLKASFVVQSQIDSSEEIAWLASAWEAVPAALIRHCWVRNGLLSPAQLAQISQDNSRAVEAELFRSLTDTMSLLTEQDNGALAQQIGLWPNLKGAETGTTPSLLDRVNALISLDDNEPTERKIELGMMPPATSQVITETDANGDLRALV